MKVCLLSVFRFELVIHKYWYLLGARFLFLSWLVVGGAFYGFSLPVNASAHDLNLASASMLKSIKHKPVLENTDKAIRIVTNNWTSQIVLSHIVGSIFSSMGYQVEYIPTDTDKQWGALTHGAAHVQVEVWEGTMSKMFNRLLKQKGIIDAGTHSATTREEWWYPAYVEEVCPGLPDWKALKNCASMFATADSSGKGVYFAGPWEKPDEARIRALGLNFKVKVLPKGDDLWIELKKAAAKKRPIVLFNWSPNWVESVYKGKFIEFPSYAPECEKDPSWGINKQFLHDCGNPKGGWLKKAAWSGMQRTWPCAFKTLQQVNFNNEQIAMASKRVDIDHLSYQEAAKQWMANNTAIWNSWIPVECKQ